MLRYKYWSYDGCTMDFYLTREEAEDACINAIADFRENAREGWDEDVELVRWGTVVEEADVVATEVHGPNCSKEHGCDCDIGTMEHDSVVDYGLVSVEDEIALPVGERDALGFPPEIFPRSDGPDVAPVGERLTPEREARILSELMPDNERAIRDELGALRARVAELEREIDARAAPPFVRISLAVVLNHVEPGWENCVAVLRAWLDKEPAP